MNSHVLLPSRSTSNSHAVSVALAVPPRVVLGWHTHVQIGRRCVVLFAPATLLVRLRRRLVVVPAITAAFMSREHGILVAVVPAVGEPSVVGLYARP